ncbi:MAG: hypothetical protein GC145_13830 [Caulobacter sp.]|nr:hypothetical protein [Caulobacter sp.]
MIAVFRLAPNSREIVMKMLVHTVAALALATAASTALTAPAAAGDLLYQAAPDSLTESLDGKPYWAAQAQCAGLFGAAAQYLGEQGDTAGAEEARTLALSFADDAIARLRRDRGLTKAEALQVISPAVLKARADGAAAVASSEGELSTWNFARSTCLDVAEAYRTQTSWNGQ